MRVLVVGREGQLGRSLIAAAPDDMDIVGRDIGLLDITDRESVDAAVAELRPDWIINAAAYTDVDGAERDEARAYAVNATAVGFLAGAAARVGGRLAHVSTDFVFDGNVGKPYAPDARPAPLNAYGRTKLAGEHAAGRGVLIVRTAWLYAPAGDNFVRTMLRLMVERTEVRVVADQIGTPTYAPGLALALWRMVSQGLSGTYHYTDAGVASWYDFAVAIQEEALERGVLSRPVPVVPVASGDFPTVARRPPYSVLDKTSTFAAIGRAAPHWRANLRRMIEEIAAHG